VNDWTRNDDRTWSGPATKRNPTGLVEQTFSDELEDELAKCYDVLDQGQTVLILFEDMFEVNDRFQAVLDWFRDRGNKSKHRWQQGCLMESGWLYFCPADVHIVPTRGVALECDLRAHAEELVRKRGLEARLRAKGLA
jgi:hypothetical protein